MADQEGQLGLVASLSTARSNSRLRRPLRRTGRSWCSGRLRAEQERRELRDSPDASKPVACDDLYVRPTVVIVDDHSGFRSQAKALLEAEGFEVVAEAEDGMSALAAVAQLHPRIVLLDIQLPDIDGFEVAERLAQAGDSPAVVLISTRDVSSYRRRLARSPVCGFVSKSELSGHAICALVW
jgi:CheY-like chemotaxis protein